MSKPPAIRALPKHLLPIRDEQLSGAACRGFSPLFDSTIVGESKEEREARHHRARALCRRCGVRTACTEVARNLPQGYREGVWAGRLLDQPKQLTLNLEEAA